MATKCDMDKNSSSLYTVATGLAVMVAGTIYLGVKARKAESKAYEAEEKLKELRHAQRTKKYAALRSKKRSEGTNGHGQLQIGTGDYDVSEADQAVIERFVEHQKEVRKPSIAEQARQVFDKNCGFGTLSTISNAMATEGCPTGSIVSFAMDEDGYPFFLFSKLSTHRHDLDKTSCASLSVTVDNFSDANDSRCVISGNIVELKHLHDNTERRLRGLYLKRHPGATWIDFPDFNWYKFERILGGKFVGGFAAASTVNAEEFIATKPDVHLAHASNVMNHMNDDHSDSLAAIVKHQCGGLSVSDVMMIDMDYLGMTLKAKVLIGTGGYTKIRIAWSKPILERPGLKEELMAMTRAAADAPA